MVGVFVILYSTNQNKTNVFLKNNKNKANAGLEFCVGWNQFLNYVVYMVPESKWKYPSEMSSENK